MAPDSSAIPHEMTAACSVIPGSAMPISTTPTTFSISRNHVLCFMRTPQLWRVDHEAGGCVTFTCASCGCIQQKFKLDLIAQRDAVEADLGNLAGNEPPGALDDARVQRADSPAALLVEPEGPEIVIGGR